MLRARQKFGKYRIIRFLGRGGFAEVYAAVDTIEGTKVALKIPHRHLITKEVLEEFYREARLAARLDHPNILALKNADFIGDGLVMSFALGIETLAGRLKRRMSVKTALLLVEQALEAAAYAHDQRIIHCDIKPENLILFSDNRLRLTDFGIAKVAQNTIRASGSGTVGYVAPEQAMGRPSQRSDVFSLGLVLYQTLSGKLPEWPFQWPPPGLERLRQRVHRDLILLIQRAMDVDPKKRFADAGQMLAAFRRMKPRALQPNGRKRAQNRTSQRRAWQEVRFGQFRKEYGKVLETHHRCRSCEGPVAESMTFCPWCGDHRLDVTRTKYPATCPRCQRGVKLDWKYCPWCYGPGFDSLGKRRYVDRRYVAKCRNPGCERKELMPFMRYCPWCRRKVRRAWAIADSRKSCSRCHWGVVGNYWDFCPWCGVALG